MTEALLPEGYNGVVSGHTAPLELTDVPAEEVIAGTPRQGFTELGVLGGVEAGIWELRHGTVIDTEVDELFVVLSGGATVEELDGGGEVIRTHVLRSGDVMRLIAGTQTRWIVDDHIRKVYFSDS